MQLVVLQIEPAFPPQLAATTQCSLDVFQITDGLFRRSSKIYIRAE